MLTRLRNTSIFETEQWLPLAPQDVFDFFSDAFNLELLTPPWLQFRVITPAPIEMQQGTVIDYRLKLRGIPVRWQSQITVWEPPHGFVDEQIRGPYRRWVHHHTFAESEGGTLARDHVDYAVPGGVLVQKLLVERDLRKIFQYRQQKLREVLVEGTTNSDPDMSQS
jgi:ligand-binding SRPBCC domain-containing protein